MDHKKLVGDDEETFNLLVEWGTWLQKGWKKFPWEKIIKAEAESEAALKAMLDDLKAYDPETNPGVIQRREAVKAKAALKACQKRKRQAAARGEASSSGPHPPKAKIMKTRSLLEKLGITFPPASDFAAVLRVYQVARIAEEIEGMPEIARLQEKLARKEARNAKLKSDLLDREGKLECCKNLMIPELQEENRLLRGQIESLSTVGIQIARCGELLGASRAEAERAALVEGELVEAQHLEAETNSRLKALEAQVQLLESGQSKARGELKEAQVLGFNRCRDIVAVLDPEIDLKLMQLGHRVIDSKIVKLGEGGEAEVLYDPSDDEESE